MAKSESVVMEQVMGLINRVDHEARREVSEPASAFDSNSGIVVAQQRFG